MNENELNKSAGNEAENDKKSLLKDDIEIFRQQQKIRDDKFTHFIKMGDDELSHRNFEASKDYYLKALELMPNNSIAKNKLADVNRSQEILNKTNFRGNSPNSNIESSENKSFAVQVETYNLKYNELREKIKEARKNDKDLYITDLRLINFKAKLHIAEITRSQKDLDIVKNMLILAEKELNEAKEEKIINVKQEVEEGAKRLIDEEIKRSVSS